MIPNMSDNSRDGGNDVDTGTIAEQLIRNFSTYWAPAAWLSTEANVTPPALINCSDLWTNSVQILDCITSVNCRNYSCNDSHINYFSDTIANDDNISVPIILSTLDNQSTITASAITTLATPVNSTKVVTTIILEPDLRIHHPFLAIILAIICVIVVFGNALTMLSVYRERYLHTVTNYFVASLAAADCLVGAIVMPFSVVHEVMNKWWIFGQDWCDLWHSFDVLASSASILNLCVISLDRYWAITDPMTYPSRMTPNKAAIFIAFLWICSALISFPAILWWRAVQKEPVPPFRCLFTDDVGYLVFSSTISFYGPLMVMVFTYYRIYVVASKQTRSLKLGAKQINSSSDTLGNNNAITLRMHRGGKNVTNNSNNQTMVGQHICRPKYSGDSGSDEHNHEFISGTDENGLEKCSSIRSRNMKTNWSVGRRLAKLAKERKAAKTLGIVMGVFILCWMPFFVTNILMGICAESCVFEPDLLLSVVTWLGWLNSAMNPAIYACWSRDFRRAFRRILCSCCISKRDRHNNRLKHNRFSYVAKDGKHGYPKHRSNEEIVLNSIEASVTHNHTCDDHTNGLRISETLPI
ncbi:dopamine receptor 2-like [Oppia nitens]|uniref:dopamine receptor 2-like n=1 Tax=Oppia nitens TaxID=1686743 RepID=UPI0023D9D5AE|nr:dopamine receptor 2-like [Oppia nitens]